MASCKDCLHVEVCRMHYRQKCELTYDSEKQVNYAMKRAEEGNPICDHFKDRSRFVELPCKVGDRLYVTIPKSKYIAEYVVIALWVEESGIIIRIVDTRFFTVSILFVRDIGTKAFLTKEQAEQALKERDRE